MAPNNKSLRYSHCEKTNTDKSPTNSCRNCLFWFHKGFSGLTTNEFNSQASLWKTSIETK